MPTILLCAWRPNTRRQEIAKYAVLNLLSDGQAAKFPPSGGCRPLRGGQHETTTMP